MEDRTTVCNSSMSNNRRVISFDSQLENEIKVSVGRMKFADFPTTSAGTNWNTSVEKTDISSNIDSNSIENGEAKMFII